MIGLAHSSPNCLRGIAPWLYGAGILLLLVVDVMGYVGKGAQRWLDLGLIRFQPSEIMKLAVPMLAASIMHERRLPPDWRSLLLLAAIIVLPVGLVAPQPDLGTALLIFAAGALVVLMAGLEWQVISGLAVAGAGAAAFGWRFLHDYQRQRIRIFLDPQSDPLGSGYHIIQSQIAIGSGGLFGKGWMNGSQAQLDFLPERSTDFIFAVIGEEFGLLGLIVLLLLYLFIVSGSVFLATQTSGTFARLLGSSLALTFFVERLASRGFGRAAAFALLAKAEPQPAIIDAMNRPAEKALAWWEYRARFLTSDRIDAGARLWREHRELLDAIALERHVPPEYLLGIIGIETSFGRITGRYRVLDALTTLAFDYPARAEYFQPELEQFMRPSPDAELDPLTTLGSYAGAMGVAQFMPSSFQRYAVHEAGTGHRDLWNDWADIFASVANYLQEHRSADGQPVLAEADLRNAPVPAPAASLALSDTLGALRGRGMRVVSLLGDDTPCMLIPAVLENGTSYRVGFQNFYAITRYNRSPLYAMAVNDLAGALVARVLAADAP